MIPVFILSFENEDDRKLHIRCYLPKVEIKNSNLTIDGKNLFDQSVKSDMRTYDILQKIVAGQGDDYTTGFLLDYNYFKSHHKIIATDIGKQQASKTKIIQ